jgi:NADPH-dependent glutamate synthase beta subunit-like oxidoreductase
MIAQGRFDDAYILNRESNVFPGILGRTCDRPCEPACRRGRVDGKPVAICRLKRVAADHKDDITARLPEIPKAKNGKKVALIGAGPASLTVANDLMPLGYQCTIFEKGPRPGGLMRINIPAFRLPEQVLDEEIGYIVNMGVTMKYDAPVTSLKALADSAPARPRARSSTCPAAARPIRSSSASSGSSRSTSGTSRRSASGS